MELPFSVMQYGNVMESNRYTWEESNRTFSTTESHLVFVAQSTDYVTFNTGDFCTFITAAHCTFNTGYSCVFNTLHTCTFNTKESCIFDVGSKCSFYVGDECVGVRRDVFEILNLHQGILMILNGDGIPGWSNVDTFESQLFDIKL